MKTETKIEPGLYSTDDKYAFTEIVDAWVTKYSMTLLTNYIVLIHSEEFDGKRKFVTLPFTKKKEAESIYRQAKKLFKHPSIKWAAFSLSKVIELSKYEASNTH